MKKQIYAILLAAAFCTMLPACDAVDSSSQAPSSSADASQTQPQTDSEQATTTPPQATGSRTTELEAALTSTSAVQTTLETEPSTTEAASQIDYKDITNQLMQGLNEIDRLGGGAFTYDPEQIISGGGTTQYAKVSDTRFSNTDDIRAFMSGYLTENMIASRYSNLVDGSLPQFKDIDGALYGNINHVTGCGFAWNGTINIVDSSATTCTAQAEYDDYGAVSQMTLHLVQTADGWRIDSIDLP